MREPRPPAPKNSPTEWPQAGDAGGILLRRDVRSARNAYRRNAPAAAETLIQANGNSELLALEEYDAGYRPVISP
jgi:hypothetical protein